MAKNKQSNLIHCLKMVKIGFIKKYFMNSGISGYSVLVNYQSLLSNFFLSVLSPPINFFYKIRQNRLLRVSFFELQDFLIYQLSNNRTEILPLVTSHIAHLCNQFNNVRTANLYSSF